MAKKHSPYASMSHSEIRNLAGQLTVASCLRAPQESFDDAFVRATEAYEHIYAVLQQKVQEATPLVSQGQDLS